MKYFITIALIFLILHSSSSFSQNDWKWGYQSTNGIRSSSRISFIDQKNNTYSILPYDNFINFQDTSFSHTGNYVNQQNVALLKLDSNGNFVNAIDFYTIPFHGVVWIENSIVVDKNMNLFIAVQFMDTLFVNESIFVRQSTSTDLVLLKFNSDFELLWGKYIYSPSQDWCHDLLLTPDGNLFMSTEHHGSGGSTSEVKYLDQVTVSFTKTILSFLKIDLNGTILWRRTASSVTPGFSGYESRIGEDGNYYVAGRSDKKIYLDEDTITNSNPENYSSYHFDIVLRPDGSLARGNIPNNRLFTLPRIPDLSGNFYFSAILWDTAVFGTDTLEFSIDTVAQIIGKMDSLHNPIWYEIMKDPWDSYGNHFLIDLKDDTLYFVSACHEDFSFLDSTYNVGYRQNLFQGKLTSEGNLVNPVISLNSNYLLPIDFKLDNCYNSIISGWFNGELIIASDTLSQSNSTIKDGFLAKSSNRKQHFLDLGNDTTITISESITLKVDEYYSNILWSTSDTTHLITIKGEGYDEGIYKFWVEAYNGACPVSDSIKVEIIDNSSIPENKINGVAFYPNPANSIIYFYENENRVIEEVNIYNQLGEKIIHQVSVSDFLDISRLQTGIYILEIVIENNRTRKKLVVKK